MVHRYLFSCSLFVLVLFISSASESYATANNFLQKIEQFADNSADYPFGRDLQSIDLSCFVSAYQGLAEKKKGFLVVDVRAKKAFNTFKVPSSINIPLRNLLSKRFIKGKKLLIMSDGLNYASLSSTCSLLKKQGVQDVKIIFGGLVSWIQSGLPVDGYPPSPYQLALVSADKISEDIGGDILQTVRLSGSSSVYPSFKGTVELQQEETLSSVVKRNKWDKKAILLINFDAGAFMSYSKLGLPKGLPIFVLNGGEAAYKAMLSKRQKIINYAQNPPQRHLTCGY